MNSIIVAQIDNHIHLRAKLADFAEGLSRSQLLKIPEGFNNNVLWNLGHLVSTQQILNYLRSGLPMHVEEKAIVGFRKGSSPADWKEDPDVNWVIKNLRELPLLLKEDYAAGKFTGFKPYTTSAGISLSTIDDSVMFNYYHEGLHTGAITALKKFI